MLNGESKGFDQAGGFGPRNGAAVQVSDQGSAGHELQRDERLAIHLAQFVNLHDVRVLEPGRRFRLDLESLSRFRAGECSAHDHLERHQSV